MLSFLIIFGFILIWVAFVPCSLIFINLLFTELLEGTFKERCFSFMLMFFIWLCVAWLLFAFTYHSLANLESFENYLINT